MYLLVVLIIFKVFNQDDFSKDDEINHNDIHY